jgi:hypothetical protein
MDTFRFLHRKDVPVGPFPFKLSEGRIEPHEILHLTVMFDHDVIDGTPAARFVSRLVALIESGYGLDEELTAQRHRDVPPSGGMARRAPRQAGEA